MLYIASDRALPEIQWSDSNPSFYVEHVSVEEKDIRGHFSLPNVAYVGAHTKCGCGFIEAPADDLEEIEARGKTVKQLTSYLNSILSSGGKLQAAMLWAGEEQNPVAPIGTLQTENMLAEEFPLEIGEFAEISPNNSFKADPKPLRGSGRP
jgi:hypothetical protein